MRPDLPPLAAGFRFGSPPRPVIFTGSLRGSNMRRLWFFSILLLIAGWAMWELVDWPAADSAWDLNPPPSNALPVSAEKSLPAIYPVGSRIKDAEAIGGFGPCDNWPKNLNANAWGTIGAISL